MVDSNESTQDDPLSAVLSQLASLDNSDSELQAVDDDQDMQDILDALLELQRLEGQEGDLFDQDNLTISYAISLNQELQREAERQVALIDQQMKLVIDRLNNLKATARQESTCKHFRKSGYSQSIKKVLFFDESELLQDSDEESHDEESASSDEENDENADNSNNEGYRIARGWTGLERKRLFEAIHSEAKRVIAHEFLKRNEPWRVWEIDKMVPSELEAVPVNRIDWERVSSLHVTTRDPNECLIQWTTQEHPAINKKPWSAQESAKLNSLVLTHGEIGQWETIANELGTNRTISQCFSRYMADKHARGQHRKWTPELDALLEKGVRMFGDQNWQHVASMFGNKSGQQCLQRWRKATSPAIVKKRWTPEEDDMLKRAMQLYGVGNWRRIQRLVPGRTDMQCRERYVNKHDESIRRDRITAEEKQRIKELVEEYGPKWSYLTQFLPGRTDNQIMKTYRSIIASEERKRKSLERKQEKEREKLEKKEAKLKVKQAKQEERAEKKRLYEQKKEETNANKKPRKRRRKNQEEEFVSQEESSSQRQEGEESAVQEEPSSNEQEAVTEGGSGK
ncbi:hypothetical protein RMATCC62417_13147 [Rhizopus microsporus]|nr:hypothetical protein RMATCC62417_13147 [Rhizopus microsporus]